MSEFIFLFRTNEAEQREAMGTPEQAQKSMEAWLAWLRGLEANGHLANPGQPLASSGAVVKKNLVTDGPYAETKDLVAGFMIIEARDLDEAITLARGCPMLAGDSTSVEIRPVAQLPS